MVKDAEKNAEEDQKRREAIETKNRADATIYQTEKLLKEHADKIDAAQKAKVESAIEKLKQAMKGDDPKEIKDAMESLNNEMQAVSTDLYSRSKSEEQPGGPTQNASQTQEEKKEQTPPSEEKKSEKGDDDVIDADFEMVDDKK